MPRLKGGVGRPREDGLDSRVIMEEAKLVWDSLKNPTTRKVSGLLKGAGRDIGHITIARWARQCRWKRPMRSNIRSSLGKSMEKLDQSLAIISGNAMVRTDHIIKPPSEIRDEVGMARKNGSVDVLVGDYATAPLIDRLLLMDEISTRVMMNQYVERMVCVVVDCIARSPEQFLGKARDLATIMDAVSNCTETINKLGMTVPDRSGKIPLIEGIAAVQQTEAAEEVEETDAERSFDIRKGLRELTKPQQHA